MLDDLLKYVPEDRRSAYLGLLHQVPHYVKTLCVVGDSGSTAGYLLKKRAGTQAYGIVHHSAALRNARQLLDGVSVASSRLTAIPLESLDAVIITGLETDYERTIGLLDRIAPQLSARCLVFFLYGDPDFPVAEAPSRIRELEARLQADCARLGVKPYQQWILKPTEPDDSLPPLAQMEMCTPTTYDPLAHAREFKAHQDAQSAFDVLQGVPAGYIDTPEFRIALQWERLQTIAVWLEDTPDEPTSPMLWAAQASFYEITNALPNDPPAYEVMARCWHAVGDVDMARRILQSIHHVIGLDRLIQQRDRLPDVTLSTRCVNDVPHWESNRPVQVLFLMNPRPHYGIDVLYDGLCDCLGDDQVIDYPYKPWLHGAEPEDLKNYPCRFNRTGKAKTFAEILAMLDRGDFDLILYADVEGSLPRDEMMTILKRAGSCPVALVDALDEFTDFRPQVAAHLRFDDFAAYFKREKHRAIDYGPNSYPLPFAYDERRALDAPLVERHAPFFWAGHRMFGIRRLYLETLETHRSTPLDTIFSPDAYIQRIRGAAIGLNCFGMGFDTVRYWEIPAQGTMLLSERLPIEIPYDFVDGEHAVFFDDLSTLIEKLSYYETHPAETFAIAHAGHARYRQYHTNQARAAQLLGWMGTGKMP